MATREQDELTDNVYAVYRKFRNREGGDVFFEGAPHLWFHSLTAARAVYSGVQARDCLAQELDTISRNESLEFNNGYACGTVLLRFPRRRGEALDAAGAQVEQAPQHDSDSDVAERLRAAMIAGHPEPVYGAKADGNARPIELTGELEQLADNSN